MSNEASTVDAMGAEVRAGDVVQIDPAHDPRFGGALLVVTEPKSFGVQGYVAVPAAPAGQRAYYRVASERFVRIGTAEWRVADADAEPQHTGTSGEAEPS